MKHSERLKETLETEEHLREILIDQTLTVWGIAGFVLFVITQIRSFNIGWGYRDLIQFGIMFIILILLIFKKKISTKGKGVILVLVCFIIAVAGSYTLGIFSGGIFFFPLSAVIVALFYSSKVVASFVTISVMILSLISYGYITGRLVTVNSLEVLYNSKSNWIAYISSFIFFLIISCVAITIFRRLSNRLLEEINRKKTVLEETNKDLNIALKEIRKLSGMLPICVKCKKVKDEKGYWEQIETYIQERSEAQFSNGLCDSCSDKLYGEERWYKDSSGDEENNK